MRGVIIKQGVVFFVLLLLVMLYSCGNSPKESNDTIKEEELEVLTFSPSKIPIQRIIYDIHLGDKYTYEELLFVLQKHINNLISDKDNNLFDGYKPKLKVYTDNNYLSYYISSSSSISREYLFGNQYWDDFECCSTLDGRIYSIEFSSSGEGVCALVHKNLYQTLLEQLTQKYGEPNHFPNNPEYGVFWMDETTILELDCSHDTDDDFGFISIEYKDNIISNEVENQQQTKGFDEL